MAEEEREEEKEKVEGVVDIYNINNSKKNSDGDESLVILYIVVNCY